jgi:hypothetical protein
VAFIHNLDRDFEAARISYPASRSLDHLDYLLVSEKTSSLDDGDVDWAFRFNRAYV